MYKIVFAALIAVILISSMVVTPSFADPDHRGEKHLKAGKQLNSKQCKTEGAKKIVNVKQKILNDADSGIAGNNWALDNYNREIEVWQLSDDSFCGILKYEGRFSTLAGPSPGNTATLDAGIKGTMEGGYRTTVFTGTFTPTKPTHGNLGTFDYQCDVDSSCSGRVSWSDFYFTGIDGFDLEWWGWQYDAGRHGHWINSIDGNFGDITPRDSHHSH